MNNKTQQFKQSKADYGNAILIFRRNVLALLAISFASNVFALFYILLNHI